MTTAAEPIKPYQGPPQTPDNFSTAYSELETMVKKGVNPLDPVSQQRLNELNRQMRTNPPKPATVINLHPWPLMFGYGNLLLRGIQIPACPPGQRYLHHYIRVWRKDWEQDENGARIFHPILPIQIAGEFVREFSNKDNDGGGVIIYEGEQNPEKVGNIEVYDSLGRVMTRRRMGHELDEEGNRVPVEFADPIVRPLEEVLKEAIALRNRVYLEKVKKADHDYKLPDGRGKRNINDKHLLMAEVLFADGVITTMPNWDLATRLDEGFEADNCPACASPKRSGAFMCSNCRHILNPFEAYKNGAIEYGHVSMEMMTSDEWEEAEEIKAERDKAKAKAGKKTGKKANSDNEQK